MEDVTTLVARRYEAFAYPQPVENLDQLAAGGGLFRGDPSLDAPLLWPQGRPPGRLRILVAGCGTVQAAFAAYKNPNDEVVGVDISETSLAHERFLQERHALGNLRLYRGDLRDVGKLGQSFDVIICSGVLHHMSDPDAGLLALRDVLTPDGVMVLMLYGQAARVGVYMLQDALQRMGVEADAEGIAKVRSILSELPPYHCVKPYVQLAGELVHDTALVDTFLHPQDRAYTVPQVFEFLERAGLEFQNWIDSAEYWRNGMWDHDSAIGAAVDALPPREHWAAVEMLRQGAAMHAFTARRKGPEPLPMVDFASSDWLRFVPHRAPDLVKVGPAQYQRRVYPLRCSRLEEFVLDSVDGRRSIAEILASPELSEIPADQMQAAARKLFDHLWKLGHVLIELPR